MRHLRRAFECLLVSVMFLGEGCGLLDCERNDPDPPYGPADDFSVYVDGAYRSVTYTYYCYSGAYRSLTYTSTGNMQSPGLC